MGKMVAAMKYKCVLYNKCVSTEIIVSLLLVNCLKHNQFPRFCRGKENETEQNARHLKRSRETINR